MSEPDYMPPFELWKQDHGIDGWDFKQWLVARFTDRGKALAYLTQRGYTYQLGQPSNVFAHADIQKRNTMGQITYEIREVQPKVPLDPR